MNTKRILSILMLLIILGAVFTAAMPTIAYKNKKNGNLSNEEEDPECELTPKYFKKYAMELLCELESDDKKVDRLINQAIDHIQKSLNVNPKNTEKAWKHFPFWIDSVHLDSKYGHMVFSEEKKAVKKLTLGIKIIEAEITELMKNCETLTKASLAVILELKNTIMVFESVIELLLRADLMLAKTAITDAEDTTVVNSNNQKIVDHQIAKANKEFTKARKAIKNDQPDKAIDHFRHAWKHAQLAIKHAERS